MMNKFLQAYLFLPFKIISNDDNDWNECTFLHGDAPSPYVFTIHYAALNPFEFEFFSYRLCNMTPWFVLRVYTQMKNMFLHIFISF